jgi:hypothetical protein
MDWYGEVPSIHAQLLQAEPVFETFDPVEFRVGFSNAPYSRAGK